MRPTNKSAELGLGVPRYSNNKPYSLQIPENPIKKPPRHSLAGAFCFMKDLETVA
jgi:hypothetical protein